MQFHRPTLLDPDTHRRDEFTSSDPSLDEWLRRSTNLDLYLLTKDIAATLARL